MNHENSEVNSKDGWDCRIAGAILIGSVLLMGLLSHHPTGSGGGFDSFVEKMESTRWINGFVHGGAIAYIGLFVVAFGVLTARLGAGRVSVRLAWTAYLVGAAGMITAAMVSGFIVPAFVVRYADASNGEIEIAIQIVRMLREVNRAADHLGVAGMSIGVLFWSVAMIRNVKAMRVIGGIGVIAGVFGLAGLVTGHTGASVHGVLVFFGLQMIWNVGVGIQLIRGRVFCVSS